MRRFVSIVIMCIGCLTAADAQTTFTQRVQQQAAGEGKVTITHTQAIDELVNGTNKATPSKQTDEQTATNQKKEEKKIEPHVFVERDSNSTEPVDMRKKVIRGGYKVTGYRVQAYAGGNTRKDRQQAEQTRNTIKARYPNEPIYVHFNSPRWICRVGNYRTYEEAHQMLQNIRKLGISGASIVKGKISVSYAPSPSATPSSTPNP